MYDIHSILATAQVKLIAVHRSLKVSRSDSAFLDLAPDSLKSLTVELSQHFDLAVLERMTDLTQLQFSYTHLKGDYSSMQGLRLKGLTLIRGPQYMSAVLNSGACRGLTQLHIDNYHQVATDSSLPLGCYFLKSELEESEVVQLANFIQSLPHLRELSGRSWLFEQSLSDFLRGWHKSSRTCRDLTLHHQNYDTSFSVWRRP